MSGTAPVVVTTSPGFGRSGRVAAVIAREGWELVHCVDTDLPDGGLAEYLERMDFLVVGIVPAHADVIAAAPRLRGILQHGVGVENIDIAAATARRIPVLNTPGATANAVAELVLGGMFALARRLPEAYRALAGGRRQRQAGTELEGKTLGLVGPGPAGSILAAKAAALGMRVLVQDESCGLDRLLAESDMLSLHDTGGAVLDAAALARMKPAACLLNYAGHEAVDTEALADALEAGRLAGAAVDVQSEDAPAASARLLECPNVVFTPPAGPDTAESVERMGLMVCEDIVTLAGGGRPARVLNPEMYAATREPLQAEAIR